MGMLDRIASYFGYQRASKFGGLPLRDPALVQLFGGRDVMAGVDVNEKTALNLSTVWACVRLISESKASMPIDIVRAESSDHHTVVADIPQAEVLKNPNPHMTAFSFHECQLAHALLWGNSFGEIVRDEPGDANSTPREIWPLTPDRVFPFYDERHELKYRVIMNPETGEDERVLEPHEVLHVPGLGFDGIRGYSVVTMARECIGLGLATERYGAAFFGNSSIPSGFLKSPGTMSEKARKNLRESFEQEHRGPLNARRLGILEEGVEWQQTSIPPEDAQFLGTREFGVVEVCRWFRTQPHLVQHLANATFTNIEHQGLDYIRYCLGPWLVRYEQEYNRKLFNRAERKIYHTRHNTHKLASGDTNSRFQAYSAARNGGWYTVNDILREEGKNTIGPEGDLLLTPANMNTLGVHMLPENKAVGENIQNTGMAGPQITSLLGIMQAVAGNLLNADSAATLITIAFPSVSQAKVAALLKPYRKVS